MIALALAHPAEIGTRESAAVDSGRRDVGQTVADAIVAWRNTDGFAPAPPPFTGFSPPGSGGRRRRPTRLVRGRGRRP